MDAAGPTEIPSESSYNVDNFLQDALGNENYSSSEITSVPSNASTSCCCDAEITSSSSSEDEFQHTIRTYRKMLHRQRKKVRPSLLSSTNTFVVSQKPMLEYRRRNIQEQLMLLSREEETHLSIMNQASKVIELCKNSKNQWSRERVESERVYSLAVLRLNAIFDETQYLKTDETVEEFSFVKGTLGISKISLKLKDDFVNDNLSKSNDNVTWFLCTIKHRNCVFGTQAVSAVEEGRINFPDFFTLDGLQTNFVLKVNVFTINMKKEDPENSTKCWHKFNRYRGMSLHPPRKIFDSSSVADLPTISSAISGFSVDSYMAVSKYDLRCKTWNLKKVSPSSPLSGTVDFRFSSSLCVDKIFDGFLTMYDEVGYWERRWFVLSDFSLKYWNYPSEANSKTPIGRINLQYILTDTIKLASRTVCPRPRTMLVDVKSCERTRGSDATLDRDKTRYLLSADTMAEVENWCQIINYLLCCLRDWNLMKL